MKDRLLEVKTSVEPHMQSLKTKSIEVYETSKSTLSPHIVKAQEVVDPYFQVFLFFLYFFSFVDAIHSYEPNINNICWTASKEVQQAIY